MFILKFSVIIWNGANENTPKSLNSLQKRVVRICLKIDRVDSINENNKELSILSLNFLYQNTIYATFLN